MKCFLEPNCVSINVGPADHQGQRTCELKNFTDESPSQTGLKANPGHIHCAVEVSDIFGDYYLFLFCMKNGQVYHILALFQTLFAN